MNQVIVGPPFHTQLWTLTLNRLLPDVICSIPPSHSPKAFPCIVHPSTTCQTRSGRIKWYKQSPLNLGHKRCCRFFPFFLLFPFFPLFSPTYSPPLQTRPPPDQLWAIHCFNNPPAADHGHHSVISLDWKARPQGDCLRPN